ncbi:glucose 1-dehydrogenase [Novosphingobium sp. PS1R-30]|uniref:Glucose 1-dehydrogenase n=1 Tax=Novosphingobium anseongense TaxID=3133436 RepID=A0ABU8RXX0_9SPHN
MAQELDGKVAIVTGGAHGIGRGAVEVFAEEGARVVIADLDVEAGEALARSLGGNARFLRTDVARKDDLLALIRFAITEFGDLDVLFNNAGMPGAFHQRLLDDGFDDFDAVMNTNLASVMHATRFAGLHMRTKGRGSIINTSSIAALEPSYAIPTYRASKAGINVFTRCAAVDLGEYGIRVNAIAPGGIPTRMNSLPIPGLSDDEMKGLIAAIEPARLVTQPLKHTGDPRDIGNMAMFLASDRAAHVTGQIIAVDGGVTAGETLKQNELFGQVRDDYLRSIGKV